MHPLMSTPSSIWLLFILIKRWPPKAKAPPLSLLFDASYFASPSEQTNDSKRNPDSSRPAHGIGEWRRHDLVVPLLYPWRERGQSHWRVGWHVSSYWLLCLCVLCDVFCAPTDDRKTVPFFWSYFFQSFVIIGVRILTWQTVIWDLFQPSARRLYLFFPVIIFSDCKTICRVKIQTPTITGKITTQKKIRYNRLAIGWNKSQITICCVKIRTPTTTRKNYNGKKKIQSFATHVTF